MQNGIYLSPKNSKQIDQVQANTKRGIYLSPKTKKNDQVQVNAKQVLTYPRKLKKIDLTLQVIARFSTRLTIPMFAVPLNYQLVQNNQRTL